MANNVQFSTSSNEVIFNDKNEQKNSVNNPNVVSFDNTNISQPKVSKESKVDIKTSTKTYEPSVATLSFGQKEIATKKISNFINSGAIPADKLENIKPVLENMIDKINSSSEKDINDIMSAFEDLKSKLVLLNSKQDFAGIMSSSTFSKLAQVAKNDFSKNINHDFLVQQNTLIDMNNTASKYVNSNYHVTFNNELNSICNKFLDIGLQDKSITPAQANEIREIIGKGKADHRLLTVEDLQKIEHLIANMSSDNPYKSELINLLKININIKNNNQVLTENYKREAVNVDNKITNLHAELNNIPPNRRNGFTNTIQKVSSLYQEALRSGDEVKIAMYSALMDKIMHGIQHGASGKDLEQIISNYEDLVKSVFRRDKGSIGRLKNFLGNGSYNFVLDAIRRNKEGKDSSGGPSFKPMNVNDGFSDRGTPGNGGGVFKPTSDTSGQPSTDESEPGGRADNGEKSNTDLTEEEIFDGIKQAVGVKDDKGNITPPEPILTDNERKDLINTSAQEIKKVIEDFPGFKKALDEMADANKKFIQAQEAIGNFAQEMQELSVKMFDHSYDDPVKDNINEALSEIINKIIEIESKLDLHVDSSNVSMADLLEKFRDIITKLDLDTRNNIRRSLEAALISQKHDAQMRDMELRWKSIDKARLEVNKMFDELKETRQNVA